MNHFAPPSRRFRRPGRRMPLGVAVAAALVVAASLPSVTLAWTDYSFSSADESEMVTLINQARASAGLPALVTDSALTSVARWRSKDMWDRNYFSHTIPSPPGGTVFDELKRRGICYTLAGENIGENNYPDDVATQTMFNGWMSSSGHRALILGSGFNHIGVGAFKGTGSTYPTHDWTAVFTHSCSGGPTPTPKPTPKPTPTPKATPRPTTDPAANPTLQMTPEVTPEVTLEPSLPTAPDLVGGTAYPIWLDGLVLEGFDDGIHPTGAFDPAATPAAPSPPDASDVPATEPPDTGGTVTDSDGGSLQVIEPPSRMGLLDTIVGGVVSTYLGK
ncbi:MAG TPA: CAP domain-containing protein [Candidatus Dormibacteraeota bacterium]|nr:CAP domain-containing protein [Candidatus Dormibacteraeota bacterium]